MVLVDKENVKGYVQMDEKEHTKKEYASKGLAGTALGLGIGGLAVSLLNNGCNPLGIFGRNCGTNAGEVAIAANEQYLERKQCADFVELVNGMWQKAYDAQKARQDDRNVLNAELLYGTFMLLLMLNIMIMLDYILNGSVILIRMN